MKVKYDQIYTPDGYSTRAICWAMTSELTDNNDGTYTVNDTDLSATFETGSEIIVIDSPGKILFVGDDSLAYDWTGGGGGGANNLVGTAVVGTAQAG